MLFVFSTASVLNRFVTGKIYVLQMLTLISMKIVGVVLASGYSTRLGLDKLTQELCGKTVIRRVVDDVEDYLVGLGKKLDFKVIVMNPSGFRPLSLYISNRDRYQ